MILHSVSHSVVPRGVATSRAFGVGCISLSLAIGGLCTRILRTIDTVFTVHAWRPARIQPRQARAMIARADGKIRSNGAIWAQLHAITLRSSGGATILFQVSMLSVLSEYSHME